MFILIGIIYAVNFNRQKSEFHATMAEADNDILELNKKVAQKLRQLRIDSGYSSYETFAFDKEINRVQYWRIENGKNITLQTLFKILKIHNISPADFFSDIT